MEEFLFRVYVFGFLLQYGKERNYKNPIPRALILSSLLFGVAHIFNVFRDDIEVYSVINQVILAFGLGMLFQSLLIRFKSILIPIVIHSIINYLGMYKRYLYEESFFEAEQYNFSDFFISLLTILVIILFVITPISYSLIRKQIRAK